MRQLRPLKLTPIGSLLLFASLLSGPASAATPSQIARFLGGMPLDEAIEVSAPADMVSDYTSTVDAWWNRFDERIGTPMTAWALEHLQQTDGTVFYPFSGADFTSVHRFYPHATRYVLVALEPGGRMPDLVASEEDTVAILRIFTASMKDFQRRGYFITGEMGERFSYGGTPFEGITPVLAMSAEREGFEVGEIRPIRVSDDGSDVVAHEGDPSDRRTWRSVRIELTRRSDGSPVLLDYLRLDLSNDNLDEDAADHAFVTAMSQYPVLVKVASYLLQYGSFSTIREAILANAPTVVQDDSGIDYAVLSEHFEVQLFGDFERPHFEFQESLQASLAQAYDEQDSERLPFRFGYWKDGLWCLQYATRPTPAEPTEAVQAE